MSSEGHAKDYVRSGSSESRVACVQHKFYVKFRVGYVRLCCVRLGWTGLCVCNDSSGLVLDAILDQCNKRAPPSLSLSWVTLRRCQYLRYKTSNFRMTRMMNLKRPGRKCS
jgi:hypothetical protein